MIKFEKLSKNELQKLVNNREIIPQYYSDAKFVKNSIKEKYDVDVSLQLALKIWANHCIKQDSLFRRVNKEMHDEICIAFRNYIEETYSWFSKKEINDILENR